MPLYEYECSTCGHRTEVIQRVGSPPVDACSECGGKMKRLLSAPAFQFKGSGWYVTDYAKKTTSDSGSKEPKAADEGGSSKEASKSSSGESAGSGKNDSD